MYLKKRLTALLLCSNVLVVNQAFSGQPQGWGEISMSGAVIESACAIALTSREQTIEMGNISTGSVKKETLRLMSPFSIRLVNCLLKRSNGKPEWKTFQITFDGQRDSKYFKVQGNADGIALRISDENGYTVIPGQPLPHNYLSSERMTLKYSLQLMSKREILQPGRFHSTVNFKINYF